MSKTGNHITDPDIITENEISADDLSAEVAGNTIKFSEIIQIITHVDPNPVDGIGGSSFIKTVPRRDNPDRNTQIYCFTFNQAAIGHFVEAVHDPVAKEAVAKKIKAGRDLLFRKMFFSL